MNEINQLERQLGRVNQQLEESERINAQFQRRIFELEQLRPATGTPSNSKEWRASIKLTWREGGKVPYGRSLPHCAVMDGTALYVRQAATHHMFCYTIITSSWSQLPDSPTKSCPSVIINNLVTFVGGLDHDYILTNQLFSLTGEGRGWRWTEKFPPMPTKREGSTALCTGTALIVAGGVEIDRSTLRTVEVLNTETLQWSTAADLPQPICRAPIAVCGDHAYILRDSSMYTCSLQALIQSRKSFLASIVHIWTRVWKEVTAPPVKLSTCVSIHGRLLAVGGRDSNMETTTAIHMYNPTANSWEVVSHMMIPRYACIAAVLPNNQLMVVGGYIGSDNTDSVEFASIE